MVQILVVAMAAFVGGLTQSVAGFGAGIVIMMVLPYLFPLHISATLSGLFSIPMGISVFWHHRHHVMKDQILLPTLCYMTLSAICIRIGSTLNLKVLQLIFGVFFICLAAFFVFFSQKLKIKANWKSAMICGSISGASGGFFSIGGPMMGAYYLSTTDNIPAYLGTINGAFAIIEIFNFTIRCNEGYVTADLWPNMVTGAVAILLGVFVGGKFVNKIDSAKLRKCIYAMMALSGVVTVCNALG